MASTEHMLPPLWRHRDAISALLEGRRPGEAPATSAPQQSSRFDTKTCLNRIRRDKVQQIHAAFDAAATTVVRAVLSPSSEDEVEGGKSEELPTELKEMNDLLLLREKVLNQARDYKRLATTAVSSNSSAERKEATSSKRGSTVKSETSNKSSTATSSAGNDHRLVNSRAVLCSAAALAFDALTPDFGDKPPLDHLSVPQSSSKKDDGTTTVNMGTVSLQAQTLGSRVSCLSKNAARRSDQRYLYRVQNAKFDDSMSPSMPASLPPAGIDQMSVTPYAPNMESRTVTWRTLCQPRLKSVLWKGAGHALICDTEWQSRHGRIADMLERSRDRLGPNIIVTTEPEIELFAKEFHPFDPAASYIPELLAQEEPPTASRPLTVMQYTGDVAQRRSLRSYFNQVKGHPSSPFHVIVTSYKNFIEDLLHFCHIPFQTAVLDEGFAWLGAGQADPNSQLGDLWASLFSHQDHHVGVAGTHVPAMNDWDFTSISPVLPPKSTMVGLTVRHRILTCSTMRADYKDSRNLSPEGGVLSFILPSFMDVVREEWDRSRIVHDAPSMDYLRRLLARSIVVHSPSPYEGMNDLSNLAMLAMKGDLRYIETTTSRDTENDAKIPQVISEDRFIIEGKVSQSRRAALSWLGDQYTSWLRYELGISDLKWVIDAMKSAGGHVCQELVTASYTTSSGASGAVTGAMAYRPAVRCGRSFGSEQGLRQHQAAHHAPPGTWLCRTCGADCITSQARTHHERNCGVAGADNDDKSKKQHGPVSVVGKKAKTGKKESVQKEKDADGSFRVPGFRGVWLNPSGKMFVKNKCKRLKIPGTSDLLVFDSAEEAAKKYDEVVEKNGGEKQELNFDDKGKRIVYDGNTAASAAGRGVEMLGGGSSSVVPALSVINIKDLPPHIKPLLRDPRQTSRTGGNSKRHVYAYRGVCRQARKGHDRWQSQISFGGTNHYLGTFDSEYDAAAIYAWAHLILYGEEATAKAQKEGEEAAAAYEREKKAIAAGETIPTPPKPEKPKKPPGKRGGKRKKAEDGNETTKKPTVPGVKRAKGDGASMISVFAKGVSKVPVLGPRVVFESKSDEEMMEMVSERLEAIRRNEYKVTDADVPVTVDSDLAACSSGFTRGCAMLLGLSPTSFGWSIERVPNYQETEELYSALSAEYDSDGYNEWFRSVIQGSVSMIGRASLAMEQACALIGLSQLPLGGTVGNIDIHIGGIVGSCSDAAAAIQCRTSSTGSDFQLICRNSDDIVTVNGSRVTSEMGSMPLFNEDVCSVGARVFVFLLPADS